MTTSFPPVGSLENGRHSLAIENNGTTYVFDGKGVADLFRIYMETPHILSGASVADKVVGKGAAALMAAGGVAALHALVVSKGAIRLLEGTGIDVSYDNLVEAIVNRAGTGLCPVETLCRDCRTPQECVPLIAGFIANMKHS